MFLLSSMTPSLFPTRTFIAIAEVLSKSKWLYFQVPFLPPFPRDEKVKLVLTGGGKKERGGLDSCTMVASAPNSHGVCFAQVWFAPASSTQAPGRWLYRGAYRDGGLPCCVPVLQQGFGQLPLGNNLHKETEGGDSGHTAAGLLNEVPSKTSPFNSA